VRRVSPTDLPVLAQDPQRSSELTGLAGWVIDVVDTLGAVGVALLVAAENVLPPVPSEVILPLAGYLASRDRENLVTMIVAATIGSVIGALLLYRLGAKLGEERLRRTFDRVPLLEQRDLDRARGWFERHGERAVLLGRMVPVVRSFISVPAGVERMPLIRFTAYTTLGSAIWNTIFVVLGYQLGSRWTTIGDYSDWINAAVFVALGVAIAVFVVRRVRRRLRTADEAA
jgi:membrane protein DedA with SNARE-associated domain